MLYRDSPEVSYIISTPYLLLFIFMMLAAALFFAEINKMKTRLTTGTVATDDMQMKQSCNYVFISTILYISVTTFALLGERFLVLQGPQNCDIWRKTQVLDISGLSSESASLDVFALGGTLKLYRQKMKNVFHRLMRWSRTSNSTAPVPATIVARQY